MILQRNRCSAEGEVKQKIRTNSIFISTIWRQHIMHMHLELTKDEKSLFPKENSFFLWLRKFRDLYSVSRKTFNALHCSIKKTPFTQTKNERIEILKIFFKFSAMAIGWELLITDRLTTSRFMTSEVIFQSPHVTKYKVMFFENTSTRLPGSIMGRPDFNNLICANDTMLQDVVVEENGKKGISINCNKTKGMLAINRKIARCEIRIGDLIFN